MPERARDWRFLSGAARLAPGVTLPDAQAELDVIAAGIAAAHRPTSGGVSCSFPCVMPSWATHASRSRSCWSLPDSYCFSHART